MTTYVNAPVHDLLIRIKNAYMARKTIVDGVVYSTFKVDVLNLLKQYQFIKNFDIIEEKDSPKKFLKIELKKVVNPVDDIPHVKFFSKPSRPWYVGYKELKLVAGGKGIGVISTNQGLMATHVAHEKKIGGELIAEIY
ncbi:MAG: 30S ribosomal protein S8 [candidate division SR1 bacterium]|nr:30S ribosomal protein S8 [candidate division SR1 bacterium]